MEKFKFHYSGLRLKVTSDIPSNNCIFNILFYPIVILFYVLLAIFTFFTFSYDYFCKAVFLLDE